MKKCESKCYAMSKTNCYSKQRCYNKKKTATTLVRNYILLK